MEVLLEYAGNDKIIEVEHSVTESEICNLVRLETGIQEFTLKIWNDKFSKHVTITDTKQIVDGSRLLVMPVLETSEIADNRTLRYQEEDSTSNAVEVSVPLEDSLRRDRWERGQFQISIEEFHGSDREELQAAMEIYFSHGTRAVTITKKLNNTIRDKIMYYLHKYSYYPTHEQVNDACQTLVEIFPCLKGPPDDLSGHIKWVTAMGYRLNYFRRTHHGNPEIAINAGQGKGRSGRRAVTSKKGELNFRPAYPIMHTTDSLKLLKEKIKIERLRIPQNPTLIINLMEVTFALRRQEVTETDCFRPMREWIEQWPELGTKEQLRREMVQLNQCDFPVSFNGFLSIYSDELKKKASCSRKRRIKEATNAAVSTLGLQLNVLSPQPETQESDDSTLLEISYLLNDKKPFYLLDGQDPSDYPVNEAHIRQCGSKYSVRAEDIEVISNIDSFSEACWILSSVYFTFNLKYTNNFKNSLFLIQEMCGVHSSFTPKKVTTFLSNIKNSHN